MIQPQQKVWYWDSIPCLHFAKQWLVPSLSEIQSQIISEEKENSSSLGQTSWIASGMTIQGLQWDGPCICQPLHWHNVTRLAIRHQLKVHGSNITAEAAQSIESKRTRLHNLIDAFHTRADLFLPRRNHIDDLPESQPTDDDVFDIAGEPPYDTEFYDQNASGPSDHTFLESLDGSGMNTSNPEAFPILLPSTLGLEWCVEHGIQSLAVKEARLRYAQANHSIHLIRQVLGLKSSIFRTQVRTADAQTAKTRAWTNIQNIDATAKEHARVYSMSRDAYQKIQSVYAAGPDLPQLFPKDLRVETLVLGSEQVGQRNTQRSWIWGFGKTVDHDGTWMNDCKSALSCLMFVCSQMKQLIGCTGYVLRHNLRGGWKNRTAYTTRLIGFLLSFVPRQRCGRILWLLL